MPAAGVFQFLVLAALAQPGDEDENTLGAIRAAVHEQFTSIKSLELQFHEYTWNVHRANWELVIDENRFLVVSTDHPNWGWSSFDGKMYYWIDYDPASPGKVRSIYRSPSSSNRVDSGLPLHLFGWKLMHSDSTFLELLDRPTVRLLGKEDVDGNTCWKVDMGLITYQGRTTSRMTAWFDPAVGYWMRRRSSVPEIVPRKDGKPIVLAVGQLPYDYTASEFGQFDDLKTGVRRWFPTRYSLRGIARTGDVILEEIRINPPVADDRFTPKIPFGTLIMGGPGTIPEVLRDPVEVQEAQARHALALERETARLREEARASVFAAMADQKAEWMAVLWKLLLTTIMVCAGFWWLGRKRSAR